jgi:hypothetical protein
VRTPSRFKGSLPKLEPVCGHSQTATPSRLGVLKQNDPRRRLEGYWSRESPLPCDLVAQSRVDPSSWIGLAAHGRSSRHRGNSAPEQAGCFLCLNEFEMEWFVKTINTTGGPVDVWAVDGVDEKDLVESPEGHSYLPRPIAAHLLTLWRSDCPPPDRS